MKLCRAAKLCFAIAAAGLVAMAAAPVAEARPKPPPIIIPPPMPPPMPDVGLGARLIDDAAVYETYVTQTSAISPAAFADAQGVADALRTGAAYEPGQLRRGAIAYAAAAALDDTAFVDAVRRAGDTPEARYAIVAKIFADPNNVLAFADAHAAAALAKAALDQSGRRIFDSGDRVRLAAYSVQHQPWSLLPVADPVGGPQRSSSSPAPFASPAARPTPTSTG